MPYVDGFVLPVPKEKMAAYQRLARKASRIWIEHGALEYREAVADDFKVMVGKPLSKVVKIKPGETLVFAWIVYRSRAHRDRVNARVVKDPRLAMAPKEMPFDVKRMTYAGFKIFVTATA